MMIKKKSNPWARMKYLYVLPLAAVAVAAFARPEISSELDEISTAKVNDLTSIVKAEEVKSVENFSEKKLKVSGKVLEAGTKIPVVGASVLIKGTTTGTITDFDGKFTLQAKKGDVIQVSYVGYQMQSIIVKDEKPLTILMKDDVQPLGEMTVVGYASNGVGAPSAVPGRKVMQVTEIPNVEEQKKDEASEDTERPFLVVEEMPKFPGGLQKAMEFLAKNMKYPVEAQQAGIEGRVIVQFVVKTDGNISDIHTVRGVSPELDAEAMRVIGLMPKWTPGKQRGKTVAVKYTMPVMFRLQDPPAPKKEEAEPYQQVSLRVESGSDSKNVEMAVDHLKTRNEGLRIRADKGTTALVVVDDEVMGKGGDVLSEIDPSQIEAISVLKGETAMAEYGDEAKDGAIIIKTKKKE